MTSRQFTFAEVCAGAGGLSTGLAQGGLRPTLTISSKNK